MLVVSFKLLKIFDDLTIILTFKSNNIRLKLNNYRYAVLYFSLQTNKFQKF